MAEDHSASLPLTPATFYVLVALADTELHGYAIIKAVSELTSGSVELGTGTLYGILKRLQADEWVVESRQRPPAAEDDERRRYYRLTPLGRQIAAAEAARLEKMIGAARATRAFRKA